eukprot:CAMPEP_0113465214 /NCGR_PEP_ID=MMETSP0014_2-20120614/13621_1 /TAXON_ID=2857 /ORGANISM="Nitzschia sp." /LENGTH=363 /DNA_ID=CAMNT_0000357359 /DNA_START=255 /DNA_END=1349 /DNA_ORIENTATION=+ /assembly_acc=CAM_ASM_000159
MSSSNNHVHQNQRLQEEDQTILPTPTKRNVQGYLTPSTSPTSVLMMMSGSTAETDGSGPCGDNSNDSSLSKILLVGPNDVTNPRSCILQVGVYAGQLCSIANTNSDGMFSVNNDDGRTGESPTSLAGDGGNNTATTTRLQEFVDCLAMLTYSLWLVSKSLNLHLEQSIQNKLHLNSIKYPVEHCKGKAGKYTEYSHLTGITKTNQSTMKSSPVGRNVQNSTKTDAATKPTALSSEANENPEVSADRIHTVQPFEEFVEQLPTLAAQIDVFATERQWAQYHTPRNLVMALLGEVGELSEILQFHGEPDSSCEPQFLDIPTKTLDKLSQEIADVTIYMLRLVTVCDVVEVLYRTLKRQSSIQGDD